MHKDSLLFLREHYPNAVLPYIQKSSGSYVNEILDEEVFSWEEAMAVLLLKVKDKHKIALLAKIEKPITARRMEYSDAIKAHILANNLHEDDISHFLLNYSDAGALTKVEIERIALTKVQSIFDKGYRIDKGLTDKLISSDIQQSAKLMFFALLLTDLNETQCRDYLRQIGLQDYLGLFEQKRPKIEITPINTRLLEAFHRKGWITKFEKDNKKGRYYRAFGRKAHKEDVVNI